jgi:hypothetical protein
MKRSLAKPKKKTFRTRRRPKAEQRIHSLRGKYKHFDLMKGLVEARWEERRADE